MYTYDNWNGSMISSDKTLTHDTYVSSHTLIRICHTIIHIIVLYDMKWSWSKEITWNQNKCYHYKEGSNIMPCILMKYCTDQCNNRVILHTMKCSRVEQNLREEVRYNMIKYASTNNDGRQVKIQSIRKYCSRW